METQTPYQKACERLNLVARPVLEDRSNKDLVSEDAYHRLIICIKAANLDVEKQDYYYEPWFKRSGSGWACNNYVYWSYDTIAGPRLRYNSYELMRKCVVEFNEYYQDFLTE